MLANVIHVILFLALKVVRISKHAQVTVFSVI